MQGSCASPEEGCLVQLGGQERLAIGRKACYLLLAEVTLVLEGKQGLGSWRRREDISGKISSREAQANVRAGGTLRCLMWWVPHVWSAHSSSCQRGLS